MKGRLTNNTTHLKLDKGERKEGMIHWFFKKMGNPNGWCGFKALLNLLIHVMI